VDKSEVDLKLALAHLQRAELDNERLTIELRKLRNSAPWYQGLLQVVPLVTALVSVAGFVWGIRLYVETQENNLKSSQQQAKKENANAEREFMKPWLESQRTTYHDALDAATAATLSSDPKVRAAAVDAFAQLYYGRMVTVETTGVSGGMKSVGRCLGLDLPESCTPAQVRERLLSLATAMTVSMAATARMSYEDFEKNQFRYE
jgi:hypothetical protein